MNHILISKFGDLADKLALDKPKRPVLHIYREMGSPVGV